MFKELDENLQQELIAAFRLELAEKIQVISDSLIMLEKVLEKNHQIEVLDTLFRAAHSIKGAARGVGLDVVAELSHKLESLFSILKNSENTPSPEVVDAALGTLDFMGEALEKFIQDQPLSQSKALTLSERLTHLTQPISPKKAISTVQPSVSITSFADKKKSGSRRWRPPPPTEVIPSPTPSIHTDPKSKPPLELDQKQGLSSDLESIHISVDKLERLGSWIEEIHVNLSDMDAPLRKTAVMTSKIELLNHWLTSQKNLPSQLSDGVGDLHILCEDLHKDWKNATRKLLLLTQGLRSDVRQLRLVKVSNLTKPLVRMVRDLSRELGKKTSFTLSGDTFEVDRAVLGIVKDPLMHLVRNAVDHGLESPEERRSRGKKEEGSIDIQIQRTGNGITLTIEDDGMGIDLKTIADTALTKKIVTQEELESMDQDQILDLIFRPGFTSRKRVTSVSGRGVGLDVVKTNIMAIQGRVGVKTRIGVGTTFTLELPLVLATERGFFVRVAGSLMVIPTKHVDRVLMLKPDQIIRVENSDAILVDGKPIPVTRLSDSLGLTASTTTKHQSMPTLVISNAWQSVACLVDDVVEEREILIKKWQPPLYSVPTIKGAVVTGTDQVVLVLDHDGLINSALQQGNGMIFGEDQEILSTQKPFNILVVDDSITTRTLEKNILEGAGFLVQVAMNGAEAMDALKEQMFDLVVTDVQMPIMDGFELTERIKMSELYREIPVIIVSSLGSEGDKQRGIQVGADAYIVKSQFETQALLDVVDQLLF